MASNDKGKALNYNSDQVGETGVSGEENQSVNVNSALRGETGMYERGLPGGTGVSEGGLADVPLSNDTGMYSWGDVSYDVAFICPPNWESNYNIGIGSSITFEIGGNELYSYDNLDTYNITGFDDMEEYSYPLGTRGDDIYRYGIDNDDTFVEVQSPAIEHGPFSFELDMGFKSGEIINTPDPQEMYKESNFIYELYQSMGLEVENFFSLRLDSSLSCETTNVFPVEPGAAADAGNALIADPAGNDTLIIEDSIKREKIALFMDGPDLVIGTGKGNALRIMRQADSGSAVERIKHDDGYYLTSGDIAELVQNIASHATDKGITELSIKVVMANPGLMDIIVNSWHEPK